MSAASEAPLDGGPELALVAPEELDRALSFSEQGSISVRRFLADIVAAARALPEAAYAINLCEDRYQFLVAFCAVAVRGQINLLPHSRAPNVVIEALARYPNSYSLAECPPSVLPPRFHQLHASAGSSPADFEIPRLAAQQVVAIGFTSGSSGQPKPNRKTWGSFVASTALNTALLREHVGNAAQLVATVPPQHMYGMETSVLLPLLGGMAVHSGRPFFPAEIADALRQAQAPRVLVTTPVHLRALLQSGIVLPPLAAVLSATAPLGQELAEQAESRWGAPVLELFGSTETCVIGHRRTARESDWRLYPGVQLQPQPDGTGVAAPWFVEPVMLQDVIELLPDGFRLCGRSSDLLEIAGKRASLGELNRRLLAVPGVQDGVVLQTDTSDANGVQRICALVVAPGLDEAGILAALRAAVDPVFLPRPLRLVDSLTRNETGKLPRAALLALLERA
jgi:acyl-coenzyme A synthetase/AMP-(fatty) acid ligase